MGRHTFLFEGGDDLTTMGACWFVAYKYYQLIDKTELRWQNVGYASRISVFNRTSNMHKYWLEKVLHMDNGNLSKAKFGVSPSEIKNWASRLIEQC